MQPDHGSMGYYRLTLLPIDKPNTRDQEALGHLPGASLHHRGGVILTDKLLPRNGCRNTQETIVL